MPALPLDDAGPYVAAAYIVFVLLVVIYVAILGARVTRIERELRSLADLAEQRNASESRPAAAPEDAVA